MRACVCTRPSAPFSSPPPPPPNRGRQRAYTFYWHATTYARIAVIRGLRIAVAVVEFLGLMHKYMYYSPNPFQTECQFGERAIVIL